MKSILNDVNRLEKAWELFTTLTVACNQLMIDLPGNGSLCFITNSISAECS